MIVLQYNPLFSNSASHFEEEVKVIILANVKIQYPSSDNLSIYFSTICPKINLLLTGPNGSEDTIKSKVLPSASDAVIVTSFISLIAASFSLL